MKNPNLISIYGVPNLLDSEVCIRHSGVDEWVPCRPIGLSGFSNRLKLAWMVFTGKADALVWPLGQ